MEKWVALNIYQTRRRVRSRWLFQNLIQVILLVYLRSKLLLHLVLEYVQCLLYAIRILTFHQFNFLFVVPHDIICRLLNLRI